MVKLLCLCLALALSGCAPPNRCVHHCYYFGVSSHGADKITRFEIR